MSGRFRWVRAVASMSLATFGLPGHAQLPPIPVSPPPAQRLEYDANGNLTKRTQATSPSAGFATRHEYDALNRLEVTLDALGGTLRLSRSASGDVLQVDDPIGARTRYLRDGHGQAAEVRSPDTGTSRQIHDAMGRVVSRTDARGVVSTITYDPIGRVTGVTHARAGVDTQAFQWSHDESFDGSTHGVGRVTSMSGPATYGRFVYDAHGRVVRFVQRTSAVAGGASALDDLAVDYGYDAAGNVILIRMPSGRVVSYTRVGGVLTGIAVAAGDGGPTVQILSDVRHEPYGPVGGWRWHGDAGTTTAHERAYDAYGRMVCHRLGDLVRDIRYDAADRVEAYTHYHADTGAAEPAWNQSFTYDALDRLVAVVWRGGARSITLDGNGNRLAMVKDGVAGSYAMQPASNRMLSAPFPTRHYGYDAAGNPTVVGLPTAEMEPSGRLAFLATPYGNGWYTYDAAGRRVVKRTRTYGASGGAGGGATVLYVYDLQDRLLGEYAAGGGSPLREYVWLGDIPVAMLETDPANPAGAPRAYQVHTDHLDTPRVLMDRSGRLRWRWLDEPYGESRAEEDPSGLGAVKFNLRMPGQVYDEESRLHYNYHRYYDPSTGRYTQSDPIGLAGGINTYVYAGSAPTMYSDPDGLQAQALVRLIPPALAGLGILEASRPRNLSPIETRQFDRYCTGPGDPCQELKNEARKAIAAAVPKMNNMLNDQTMFGTAGWRTHGDDLTGRIGQINAIISLGQKMGCDMSAEIVASSALYVPNVPLRLKP